MTAVGRRRAAVAKSGPNKHTSLTLSTQRVQSRRAHAIRNPHRWQSPITYTWPRIVVTSKRCASTSRRATVDIQYGNDAQVERYRRAPMIKFLDDVRAAGGTVKKFFWAPRADLCMLRLLCERGRAAPRLGQVNASMTSPRIVDREEHDFLVRVFAWAPAHRTDARRRTRSARVAVTASQSPLPREVFKHVLSFWQTRREWWWHRSSVRYGAPEFGSWH